MNPDTNTTMSESPKKGGAVMSLIAVIVLIIIAIVIALAVGAGKKGDMVNPYQNGNQTGQESSQNTTNASIESDLNQTGQDIDAANMNEVSF